MKVEPADNVVEEAVPVTTVPSTTGSGKHGRDPSTDNEDDVRHRKRVALSLTKPSYLLGVGFPEIRPENRGRLKRLLEKLFRTHNWANACGVASVFLKSTQKDRCPRLNRFKFSTSMELLRHLESGRMNDGAISSLYDAWMASTGVSFSKKKKTASNEESDIAVRLESIVFLLFRGHIDSERQNARSLIEEHGFENNPVLTMVVGMIFYELWYSDLPECLQLKCPEAFEICSPPHSPAESLYSTAGADHECGSVHNDGSSYVRSLSHHDTDTSVRLDKEMQLVYDGGCHEMETATGLVSTVKREYSEDIKPRGFYLIPDGNEASSENDGGNKGSITKSYAIDKLDSWVFPLRTKMLNSEQLNFNDEYMFALKCLQDALHAKPSLAALLPLVQLLLIGREYEMALEEVDSFAGNSNNAVIMRIKTTLLELVDPNNATTICKCYEETLNLDPTCSAALAKLITYHDEGVYASESLLESIAVHLEAAYPDHIVWKVFASCFLRVSQGEEDRMSAFLVSNGEQKHHFSDHYNGIPKYFMEGDSGKAWKLRWRWWSRRHFCSAEIPSHPFQDELELITYKAACASHLYGKDFDYVSKVYSLVHTRADRNLFKVLQLHIRNSFGLHFYLQRGF